MLHHALFYIIFEISGTGRNQIISDTPNALLLGSQWVIVWHHTGSIYCRQQLRYFCGKNVTFLLFSFL